VPSSGADAKLEAILALALGALAMLAGACGEAPEIAVDPPDPCATLGTDGVLEIESGSVRGVPGERVCAFRGLPYAAAPVGPRRFSPPTPAPFRSGAWQAREPGPLCLQVDGAGALRGSEDCLYLNVWTPDREPLERLPVALFLHGGGNVSGSSTLAIYDGSELAARGHLVVVSANYRLGALGYLAHPALSAESSPPSSGNYGLLDQIAVLEWIQNNIAAFGGDRERVLVFGQSAGGRNLCALLVSPRARGLFQRAVVQSGACELQTLAEKEAFGQDVARAAGCPDGADAACLRGVPVDRWLKLRPSLPSPLDTSDYNPNVDGALIPAALRDLLAARADRTPLLITTTADEIGHVLPEIESESGYERWLEAVYGPELAPRVLSLYPAAAYASPRDALVAAVSDGRYACPARSSARQASRGGPTYRALFAHGLDHGERARYGAYHGLELDFVFRTFAADGYAPSSAELALSDALIEAYARFARTGSPAGGALPFSAYATPSEPYTRIDTVSSIEHDSPNPRCDFWDALAP
jgi:para-nitrobenzyl esterase